MRKNLGVKTYVMPQPAMVLATYNSDGTVNAMTAAWCSIYNDDQVYVCIGNHKTCENLKQTGAFTLHVCDTNTVLETDYLGMISGEQDSDKVCGTCKLTCIKSEFVNAPVLDEFGICIECTIDSYENESLIGRIKNVSVREDILGEDGLPDYSKYTPVAFDPIHHNYVKLGEKVAKAFCDGLKLTK